MSTPVSVVAPVPPFATVSVPVTPVDSGSPVALVSVTADGVPKLGVVRAGEDESTTEPDPVDVVTPVPPFATASVPATVTAPPVAVEGVKPVLPKLIDDMPDVILVHVGALDPLEVRTCPLDPADVNANAVPVP